MRERGRRRGRKVVQKDRQAVTTRYADCVRVCEGVSTRVCVYNLKRLAITNDTSRCEINTVTQSAELDRQTEGAEQQTERRTERQTNKAVDRRTHIQREPQWVAVRHINVSGI